jgi:hypothetical protein
MSTPDHSDGSAGHHSLLRAADRLADLAGQPGLGAGRRVHDALHAAALALEDHFEIARASEDDLDHPELRPQLAILEREMAMLLDACWETVRGPEPSEAVLRVRLRGLAHGLRRAAEREIALVNAAFAETPALD